MSRDSASADLGAALTLLRERQPLNEDSDVNGDVSVPRILLRSKSRLSSSACMVRTRAQRLVNGKRSSSSSKRGPFKYAKQNRQNILVLSLESECDRETEAAINLDRRLSEELSNNALVEGSDGCTSKITNNNNYLEDTLSDSSSVTGGSSVTGYSSFTDGCSTGTGLTGETALVLQNVLGFAKDRLTALETLYDKETLNLLRQESGLTSLITRPRELDSETLGESIRNWKEDMRRTLHYSEDKERAEELENDICGEHETANYLEDFKRRFKRLPACVRIQSWWRSRRRVRQLRCVNRWKLRVCHQAFSNWTFSIRSAKLVRKVVRRRFLTLWREVVKESRESRRIIATIADKHSDLAMTEIMLRVEKAGGGLSRATISPKATPSKSEPNSESGQNQKSAIDELAAMRAHLNSDEEREKGERFKERMRHMVECRQKRKAWDGLKAYLRSVQLDRTKATLHLMRMVNLARKTAKSETFWVGERVQVIFLMWSRWTKHIACMRLGKPSPKFDEYVPRWNAWITNYTRRAALKKKAAEIGPGAMLRRYFYKIKLHAKKRKQRRRFLKIAKAKYEHTRQHLILKHWFAYARTRGGIMRFKRNHLVAWYKWAQRKKRHRVLKEYLGTNLRSSHTRHLLDKWRVSTKKVAAARMYRTDRLLNENTLKAQLACLAIFVWKKDDAHVSFLRSWKAWKVYTKRKRVWNAVKFKFFRTFAMELTSKYFAAWREACRKKKGNFTIKLNSCSHKHLIESRKNESEKNLSPNLSKVATVSKLIRGVVNVEPVGRAEQVLPYQEFQEIVATTQQLPIDQWNLEQSNDLETMAWWMQGTRIVSGQGKVMSPPTQHVIRCDTPLHVFCNLGNVDQVGVFLRQCQSSIKTEKTFQLDEAKRRMDIDMRKSMAIEQQKEEQRKRLLLQPVEAVLKEEKACRGMQEHDDPLDDTVDAVLSQLCYRPSINKPPSESCPEEFSQALEPLLRCGDYAVDACSTLR